ncbi:MAG: tetratricopeptide repeat protein [Oceanicoccus sp.]
MSDSYRTEEEQVEALKSWWRENGKSTVVAIAIGVLGVFGWQGWQKQQQADQDTASAIYQNLLTAANGDNGSATLAQIATANHLADTLKADFTGTTYAYFAALYKAKFAVDDNDLESAAVELQWVLDNAETDELRTQARLRLAKVLLAQSKLDEAMKLIAGENMGYDAAFSEVRGDILAAQGDSTAALAAYQQARDISATVLGGQSPLLSLKIQQLENTGPSGEDQPADEESTVSDSADKGEA